MSSLFRRIRRRIGRTRLTGIPLGRPSSIILAFIMTAVMLLLFAGGVYNIMIQPPVLLPTASNPIFYYYGLQEQSWSESFVAILLFAVGSAGGFLSYRSTRYAYKPREAAMLLAIGIILMFLAFIGCEYVIWAKRGL